MISMNSSNRDKTIKWSGYEWILKERWGDMHPDKPICWYDPKCVRVDGDYLFLGVSKNAKEFNGNTVNFGIGLVSCTERFGYGEYSIDAKLPTGRNLWPAFWMWSWDSWPPEIDVFEGYTGRFDYLKFRILRILGFWNVQTNVHYRDEFANRMTGGRTHWFGFKNPSKNFINYKVEWNKGYIKFYYNNRMVRNVTDPRILESLWGHSMNVVINNSIKDGFTEDNLTSSELVVKNFKYTRYPIDQ